MYDLDATKQTYLIQFYNTLLAIKQDASAGGDIVTPRLTLIALTKVKIDELMSQSEGTQFNLTAGDNSNVIDLYINSLLDGCTKLVLQTAPIHVIEGVDGGEIIPVPGLIGTGYIFLPDGYLRCKAFKMASWHQEVSTPIKTTDDLYKRQKYAALRGGIAKPVIVLNSKVDVQTPVAKVTTVTLVGVSGKCIINVNGLEKEAEFNGDLATTASDFVTANATAYLTIAGLVLTNPSGSTLTFTANVAGLDYVNPFVVNTVTDLNGLVAITQPNVPARQSKRTLEYYTDPDLAVTLEKFIYVANIGAQFLQSDLHDALTWLCASQVLQIWGQVSGNTSYSEKAMSQVELSYQNLL